MEFSLFGEKFTRHAGITQLMDDLNQGLLNPDAIMLGGGNPAPIPAMLERFQAEANTLLDNGELIKAMANYDGPRARTGSPGRWPPCSARSWAGRSPPATSP